MILVQYESRNYRDEAEALNGKTVNDVYDAVKVLFELPEVGSLDVRVNSEASDFDREIEADDQIEFVSKQSGKKGFAPFSLIELI